MIAVMNSQENGVTERGMGRVDVNALGVFATRIGSVTRTLYFLNVLLTH